MKTQPNRSPKNDKISCCSKLNIMGSSIFQYLGNCFPISGSKTNSMADQDKLRNLELEWHELYNRVDKLEVNTVKISCNTKNTDKKTRISTQQQSSKLVKNLVDEEVKQLFSRIDLLEKRLDENNEIQKNNLDIMVKLDQTLKKLDNDSWCSVSTHPGSVNSQSSNITNESDITNES